ncbi:MAG: phosphatidate cytidylyltransferase, partial [Acidimicrobiia bacterium]|nr:phosphatidate cytidylyltransferase [Acidimicrobiia bacterium]
AAEYEDVELGSGELSSLVEPSEEEVPVGSVSEGESEDDLAAAVAALGADEEPEVVSEEPVEPEVRPGPGAVDDLPTQLTIDGTVTDEDVPPAHDEIDEVAVPDAGDPGRLPSSWFAEIDEDEVEPPPHTVPEDDYEAEAPPEPAEVAAVAAVDAVMEDALDTASDLDVVEASAEIDDGAVRPEESAVVEEPPVIEEPPVVEEAEEAGLADDAATVEPVVVDEPVAADEPAVDEPVIPGAEEDTFSLPDFGEFRFEDDAPVAEASGPDDDETPPAEAADDLTDGDVVWRASDGEPDEPGLWAPAGPPRVPLGHDDDEPTAEIWPPDLGYEHPGAPEQDPEFVPEPDESLDAEAAMAAAFDELDRAAAEAQEFELAAPGPAESDEAEVPEGDADDREPDEWDAGRPDAGGPWDGSTEDAPIDVYDHEEADLSEGLYSGAGTVEHRGLAEAVEAASRETTERTALSAPMAGIETGVVGFEDVEDLGTGEEYEEPDPSDLGVRVATGVTLIALVVAAIWAGGEWLAVLLGGFVMLALYEFYRTLRSMGYHPVTVFGYLGGIATYALTWFHGPIAIPASIVATAVVVYFVYTFTPQRTDALTNGGLTVLGVAWIAGTAAFALPIVATADFRVLVFGVVVATVAMDVGAYFFGRSFGNARLAPVLSPNKSIEGLAGGVMLCLGATIGWGWLDLSDPMTIRTGAWLGLVVALAAPLGDLAESMVKRSLGVKDMGSILPGHGGILDRIDAFLFAIPPAWILFEASGLLV